MELDGLGPEAQECVEQILGYLNFSSGADDPRFFDSLNRLGGLIQQRLEDRPDRKSEGEAAWCVLGNTIQAALERLHQDSEAFRQVDQARAVLRLVFQETLPAYREHHGDLLFHHSDQALFQPLFIGRVCQAVLEEGAPWDQRDRIVEGALTRLNDFIGHRPVAVLRSRQKLQPYANEWVRPIPLFIDGAGVAKGRYHDLVQQAFEILESTDPDLLSQAWFDPELLGELALDPRAFDFDHPVNRRPNYHFGCWDPHRIDNKGRYDRFVLKQVTVDAMLARVEENKDLPHEEVLFEAAAVLAGTMLMGSGISGNGPDCHDSDTSLATLLPLIAGYRDAFYEQLIQRLPKRHARRLRSEAKSLRQPFAGARQDLNQRLARHRAQQLQHVHLARLFARMGYIEAAVRQADAVPVTSARMRCEIDCRLSLAHLNVDRGQIEESASLVPEIEDLLHRAIECGALVDPWNILGFSGQYSLFGAIENSVYDHRVDELIELINDIFALYARLLKEAAATGKAELEKRMSKSFEALAEWWDQFASVEVSDVEGVSGRQAWESATQVATALGAWHKATGAAGDVAFWSEHIQRFNSPKAFTLLVESLLDLGDPVASMALLTYWLSQSDEIPLTEGDYSLHPLAFRWMEDLWLQSDQNEKSPDAADRWSLARKFFDFTEANAEDYWQVPELELADESAGENVDDQEQVDGDEDDLFSAAYENVTYRDTAEDGFEGEMLEWGDQTSDFELAAEGERISDRLAFLVTLGRLWKLAAAASGGVDSDDRDEVLSGWLAQATTNQQQLLRLLATVNRHQIPPPRGTHDSLVEYSRRQGIKELLLERIVAACVETADAARFLMIVTKRDRSSDKADDWEAPAGRVLRAVYHGDVEAVRADWPELLESLSRQQLLYVPTARGGNPQKVVASRSVQLVLHRLLTYLPRLGLLSETYQLIGAIHQMEQHHPTGPGAVTEFDRLFEIGCKGIVECLVHSSEDWATGKGKRKGPTTDVDAELIRCLQPTVELLMECWLSHSRNIRISVLESVSEQSRWEAIKEFIERYGGDLFSQQFMNFGNLRAIMHQGVDFYLDSLLEQPEEDRESRLLDELDGPLPRDTAVYWLEVILESILENYSEYIDYNSTTTQSDRGELLYTLLDFLRLEASYDRVAWNLRPVVIAHEVLVRNGRAEAAELWRRAVSLRTGPVADNHLQQLDELSKLYGMRLPSVTDRLGERFIRPLDVDRLCALVEPAVDELRDGNPDVWCEMLEEEVSDFTAQPSGVGFEVPLWLEALENEVERTRFPETEEGRQPDPALHIRQVRLTRKEIERQVNSWEPDDNV